MNDLIPCIAWMISSRSKNVFQNQFEELRTKLNIEHGTGIVLTKDDSDRWDPNCNIIYISSNPSWEKRYYVLLHEWSHVVISRDRKIFEANHPMYASSIDNRRARSKAYRVSLIAEEIEAWKIGRIMGRELGHIIDDHKFDKMMTDNVMSYISWAHNGGGE